MVLYATIAAAGAIAVPSLACAQEAPDLRSLSCPEAEEYFQSNLDHPLARPDGVSKDTLSKDLSAFDKWQIVTWGYGSLEPITKALVMSAGNPPGADGHVLPSGVIAYERDLLILSEPPEKILPALMRDLMVLDTMERCLRAEIGVEQPDSVDRVLRFDEAFPEAERAALLARVEQLL